MFQHILVPLDGSPLAEAALGPALALADKFGSEITLLRVSVQPYLPTDGLNASYADLIAGLREQALADARTYLATQQGSLRQQGYSVHAQVTELEPVAEAILNVAEADKVDTIVMSTHGRGGLSRWVYGSVADRVLRHAHVPVLLIRPENQHE